MAGAINAALFLEDFVPADLPWLHIDLFAWNDSARPGRPVGGEAQTLRTLLGYLEQRFTPERRPAAGVRIPRLIEHRTAAYNSPTVRSKNEGSRCPMPRFSSAAPRRLRGVVRTVTLNRPAALNSFTAAMHARCCRRWTPPRPTPRVRAVVITGAGRGFCAGQDLNDPAMAGASVDVGAVIERLYRPLAMRVRTMPVPVIAAVNGVAAGAGANFALCCDFVLAARSASFIQAF